MKNVTAQLFRGLVLWSEDWSCGPGIGPVVRGLVLWFS